MKALLLFLSLSCFTFGQNLDRLKNLDATQKEEIIKEIISATGKNYQLTETTDKERALVFSNPEDTSKDRNDDLIIAFFEIHEGENKALEIKGVEKWKIRSISGKFLSLAPIWKKFIDPKCDIVELSKHDSVGSPNDRMLLFYKNNNFENFWTIRF